MAAKNPDSMGNAQGEFTPRKPRDEPLETHGVSCLPLHSLGDSSLLVPPPQRPLPPLPSSCQLTNLQHQPGQKTSAADFAPEFCAQTLPAGTAPEAATYQPNPVSEVPGQADNEDVLRGHGQGSVRTDALSTLGGATSADVHTGLGHPAQGQTSSETRGDRHASKGAHATGGGGLRGDDGLDPEFRRLQQDDNHPAGPASGHNVARDGAEAMIPVGADEVAAELEKGR